MRVAVVAACAVAGTVACSGSGRSDDAGAPAAVGSRGPQPGPLGHGDLECADGTTAALVNDVVSTAVGEASPELAAAAELASWGVDRSALTQERATGTRGQLLLAYRDGDGRLVLLLEPQAAPGGGWYVAHADSCSDLPR